MMKTSKSNEDPGGNPSRYHEGQPHRPIVTITNSKREVVQFTPRFVFLFSNETLLLLRSLMNGKGLTVGTNGKTRIVAQSGGMVRYPAGSPDEGTETHAFPVTFTNKEHAEAIESRLREVAREFETLVPGARFLGFVEDQSKTVLEMETERSQAEFNAQRETWEERVADRRRLSMQIIGTDGSITDSESSDGTIELNNHETPPGDDEQRENNRNDIGARAAEA